MTPEEAAERLSNAIGRNVTLAMEVDDLKAEVERLHAEIAELKAQRASLLESQTFWQNAAERDVNA